MALPLSRLSRAFTSWPHAGEWALTLALLLLFGLSAFAVLKLSGELNFRPSRLSWPRALLLAGAAFLSPSLLEETLYRVLLVPHPLEPVSGVGRFGWAAFSLGLYVLAHPLVAWRWRWARRYFWRPAFLLVVALLGLACSLAYVLTGSVWPPVLIHGLVVAAWKGLFGGPGRPFAGITRVE